MVTVELWLEATSMLKLIPGLTLRMICASISIISKLVFPSICELTDSRSVTCICNAFMPFELRISISLAKDDVFKLSNVTSN